MLAPVLADIVIRSGPWGLEWGTLFIIVVMVAACCALVAIALRRYGMTPPSWVIEALCVVLVAFVVIVCIRLVLSM